MSVHPHCVRLFGTCVVEGSPGSQQQDTWLVMEAAKGSMRDLLVRTTPTQRPPPLLPRHECPWASSWPQAETDHGLSLGRVMTLAADAAVGLAFLHSRGIAHRDMAGTRWPPSLRP